jgi:hypothetical protein
MAGDEQWSDNCKRSADILAMENYVPYEMKNNGFINTCDIKPSYTYTNILFVPKEKTGLISHLIQ